jgi:hypothetical protein
MGRGHQRQSCFSESGVLATAMGRAWSLGRQPLCPLRNGHPACQRGTNSFDPSIWPETSERGAANSSSVWEIFFIRRGSQVRGGAWKRPALVAGHLRDPVEKSPGGCVREIVGQFGGGAKKYGSGGDDDEGSDEEDEHGKASKKLGLNVGAGVSERRATAKRAK